MAAIAIDLNAGESPKKTLKSLKSFASLSDSEARYVVMCYGKAGFSSLPQGAEKRRAYCMEAEGLTDKTILAGTNDRINAAAGEFIVWQDDLKFEEYVSLLDLFHNVTMQMRLPIIGDIDEDKEARAYDTKIKCANAAEGLRVKIEALREALFGRIKDEAEVITRTRKGFAPEKMARKAAGNG